MKIYEVFVCVPYLDPDYNECDDRQGGVFFANKNDAKMYLDKMFRDKEANYKLNPRSGCKAKRRYVSLSDYKETDFGWNDLYGWSLLEEKPEEEINNLEEILKTNDLVDSMKWHEAILLAVTYGGNRWYLREAEVH